ncbi:MULTISPECIES: hypothetical protein [Rhizobiaceae]|uniref:Uncharacterized protein n=1 Tax=Aliirhizobium cellulosilyticum TaxID=393664 RepID=A0A7W6TB80_9HYPH|nr:hypothetical protein [Rhizobium cellulosilyticum]MBB4347265.1 hypothetical protein [Rhizobium cellulosilyticum]MBB4410341.1 hypothetical protein [Rhizobium cellulosilyticum]MBB4445028.1 hypothetical protein [Rhizobium cellulosilyticum]
MAKNKEKIDMPWDNLRANKISDAKPPAEWPAGVVPISIDGLALFGVHEASGELYWDGKRVETRITLARREAILAFLVAAATISMAVFDAWRFFKGE